MMTAIYTPAYPAAHTAAPIARYRERTCSLSPRSIACWIAGLARFLAGRPLPGGARVGAGIWAHPAVPSAARPVSAEPQSDVCRRGCCLAWMGAVLRPPACLGGAGHPVRRLRRDRAVGRAAAPGSLRRRLPGLHVGGSALGAAHADPARARCRCIDRPRLIRIENLVSWRWDASFDGGPASRHSGSGATSSARFCRRRRTGEMGNLPVRQLADLTGGACRVFP